MYVKKISSRKFSRYNIILKRRLFKIRMLIEVLKLRVSGSQDFRNIDAIRLYCTLIRSHLEYASFVWLPYHIEALETIQKKS